MQAKQPLTNRKLATRGIIGLFAIAAIVWLYTFLKHTGSDIDTGAVNSVGWIATLRRTEGDGFQAVVIKPDGSILESPGYVKGAHDQHLVWRPDGNRIFFSSDREDNAYNLYRWNLATNVVERRTLGKLAKTDPSFPQSGELKGDDGVNPLFVFQGMGWQLDVKSGSGSQMVPTPTGKNEQSTLERSEDAAGGSLGAFGAGTTTRFRSVRFFKGTNWFAAIKRTNDGEAFVIQKNGADPEKPDEPGAKPTSLYFADKIQMAVDPATGKVVVAEIGFQFPPNQPIPEAAIDPKTHVIHKPFRHAVMLFDPEAPPETGNLPVAINRGDNYTFTQPAISPDGSTLLLTLGPYVGGGQYGAPYLTAMPCTPNALGNMTKLYPQKAGKGAPFLLAPSWSPDGTKIIFTEYTSKTSVLKVINKDGSNPQAVAEGKGNFGPALFSPQK
jgi:hypothetical protein